MLPLIPHFSQAIEILSFLLKYLAFIGSCISVTVQRVCMCLYLCTGPFKRGVLSHMNAPTHAQKHLEV